MPEGMLAQEGSNLHTFRSATRKSAVCLSERPICRQADRQAGSSGGAGGGLQTLMSFRFMGGGERRLLGLWRTRYCLCH